jgi:hypothetical protein
VLQAKQLPGSTRYGSPVLMMPHTATSDVYIIRRVCECFINSAFKFNAGHDQEIV